MSNSASERLYDELKNKITSGETGLGEKLPTEQYLCDTYGVGRSTVREAMRILQAKGFVEIRRGSGAYVVSQCGSGNPERRWLSDNKNSIRDYMDVRTTIEIFAVKCMIANGGDVRELEEIENRFEDAVKAADVRMMTAMDKAFHECIAKQSGNTVLVHVSDMIQHEFEKYRRITFEDSGTRLDAIAAHRNILGAISRRDTDDAVFNIRHHLTVSMDNAIRELED